MKKMIPLTLVLALCMVVKADFIFGEPVNLGPPINSSFDDGSLTMTPDGLELYFDSGRQGWNLWVTRRATITEPWGEPERVWFTINSAIDFGPCLSANGLELYYTSNRGGAFDIWVANRTTISESWGSPVNLGPPVNSSSDGLGPTISVDGLELFFGSNRSGGSGGTDLWVAKRETTHDPWSKPVNLGANVNSPAVDNSPIISTDGLLLFFESNRSGGYGAFDIWYTRREATNDDWGPAINLGPPINTSRTEYLPGVSSDGKQFDFVIVDHPDGFGGYDIWRSPIIPVVDLNADGIVDSADMVIMVDHWGTDNSLCDIGPMPWGDGIVDVEDLIILAEHLFEEVPQP